MAQLDFPLNPALNQVYTAGQGSWIWDGIKWESAYSAQLYLPLIGGSLAGPGNLAVGGTLNVTGTTTLGVLTAGSSTLAALNVTGTTTLTGLTVNGQVVSQGANAGFQFLGRDTGQPWTWYAQSGIARLFYIGQGDRVTIDTGGNFSAVGQITTNSNVIGNNSVQSNGVYFQNNSGWFYTPQNFFAGGAVGVAGSTGLYWTNSGGWMYTTGNLLAAGNVAVSGNTGFSWSNNANYMYCPQSVKVYDFVSNNNVNAAGVVYVGGGGGPYWQNNGGWMYSPQGVWCANINTGPIQQNGNSVNGGGNYNSNGTAWGGWGAQYNWTGNGYWVAFQCTDAFYAYNNQGLAGGVYWTYCDERMKWNFRPVTRDCLAAVNAIELKGFDFSEGHPPQRKINPYETRTEHFIFEELPRKVKHIETGFVAQQLREIIPEAVPDPPQEGAYLSVDMRPMVATLIGAVQQLTARLKQLEGR